MDGTLEIGILGVDRFFKAPPTLGVDISDVKISFLLTEKVTTLHSTSMRIVSGRRLPSPRIRKKQLFRQDERGHLSWIK